MPPIYDLEHRTLEFSFAVVRWVQKQQPGAALEPVLRQVVKAATGIGANYRAALRARSYKEFTARLGIAAEEADESVYWLEIIWKSFSKPGPEAEALLKEALELRSIVARSVRTARTKLRHASRTTQSSSSTASA